MSNYVVAGYVVTLSVISLYAFRIVRRSIALQQVLKDKLKDKK